MKTKPTGTRPYMLGVNIPRKMNSELLRASARTGVNKSTLVRLCIETALKPVETGILNRKAPTY